MQKYATWIADHVKGDGLAMCSVYTERMVKDFPELIRVRGWCYRHEHWWCKTADGTIVDPTASQFETFYRLGLPSPSDYREFRDGVDPEPIGRCMGCGEYVWEKTYGNYACSKECLQDVEYEYG